jgi:3-hydroxybutyrate dehydrogenase
MSKRTILITGAGSGIGRGLALHTGAAEYRVVATDIDEDSARQTADEVVAGGGQAESRRLDVTSQKDVQHVIDSLDEPVDVLINNAGLQHVARLEEFPQEMWDLLIRVMLNGPCMMTRSVLPGMRDGNYGRIINIGSIHSLVASPFKTAYVAAKHGLLGFAKAVALETADTDITINTICPSYVKTPLVERQIADQARTHGIREDQVINDIMLKPMPKGAFVSIRELGGVVALLVSDSGRNITGQTITVDGGWTVR